MTAGIIAAIGGIITLIIMFFTEKGRKDANRRKEADEAKKQLETAHTDSGSVSDVLDSWRRV